MNREEEIRAKLAEEERLAAAHDAISRGSVFDRAAPIKKSIANVGDAIGTARAAAEEIAANPGDSLEKGARAGIRALAIGTFRGARAIWGGISDAHRDLDEKPETLGQPAKDAVTAQPHLLAPETPSTDENWFDRQIHAYTVKAQAVADDERPLWKIISGKILYGTARQTIRFTNWSGRTYPPLFQLVAWAPGLIRRKIDRNIAKQGYSTPSQRLTRKIFGMRNPHDMKFRFRYAAINLVTLGIVAPIVGVDAFYNYASYTVSPDPIHIVSVDTQSDSWLFSYKVNAYKKAPNGEKESMPYDIDWSIWYPFHLPRSTIALGDVKPGYVCTNVGSFGYYAPFVPLGLRRLAGWYPQMLHADCRPDSEQMYIPKPEGSLSAPMPHDTDDRGFYGKRQITSTLKLD